MGIMPHIVEGDRASGARHATKLVLLPLATLIEAELTTALETPVRLDFTRLQLGALRERAQTVKALVDAGVDQAKALDLAGLSS